LYGLVEEVVSCEMVLLKRDLVPLRRLIRETLIKARYGLLKCRGKLTEPRKLLHKYLDMRRHPNAAESCSSGVQ
jgi:hypothetical protein